MQALGQGSTETRVIPSGNLEVAVLDRTRTQQRKFKRLTADRLGEIIGNGDGRPGRRRPRHRPRHPGSGSSDTDVPPLDPPVAPPVS